MENFQSRVMFLEENLSTR